jgi:hypothetical protein
MSDSLSIAAVTATLRNLLFSGLNQDVAGTSVTTRPPDKARSGQTGSQVNLFLYHLIPDTAWRNMEIPWRTRPGESGPAHLPLRLHYLLTAYYGENEDDIDTADANRLLGSQRLLGRAISLLLDHAILDPAAVQSALPPQDQLAYPFDSLENVRLTFQPLSLDEISKLWSGFQTQYRLSAAFEVSMVLIESRRPARAPLPVLTIGTNDAGVTMQTGVGSPLPAITTVQPPNGQPSARLDEMLTLQGHHLAADDIQIHFNHRLWENPRSLTPIAGAGDRQLRVQLPDLAAEWPAGIYTVSAVLTKTGAPVRTTNALPFALAPQILGVAPNPAQRDSGDSVTLTITCRPEVRPGQSVCLLLGQRQIMAQPIAIQTDTLIFDVADAALGDHFLRLRIEGVDSLLIHYDVSPPIFDHTRKVTITP